MAQAALILSEYSAEVVVYVTDPRTGIQRTSKFPPTIEEIAKACDARMQALRTQAELDAWRERKRKSDEVKAIQARYPGHSRVGRPGQITYDEFLAMNEGKNTRPIGRFEKDSPG